MTRKMHAGMQPILGFVVLLVALLVGLLPQVVTSWSLIRPLSGQRLHQKPNNAFASSSRYSSSFPPLCAVGDDSDNAESSSSSSSEDEDDDRIMSWKPDPLPPPDDKKKSGKGLGINIGSMLQPLTVEESAELKAAATEIINEKFAEGLDDMERMRKRLKRDLEKQQQQMQYVSEMNAQWESDKLTAKIDKLTSDFLGSTESSRTSTKMAAAADQAMEGKAVEVGVWGSLGGASVGTAGSSLLFGSVEAAKTTTPTEAGSQPSAKPKMISPSIVILADVQADEYAKPLVPRLQDSLQRMLPGVQVRVFKPTDMLPVGGDNADCVIIFAGSFSSASTINTALDRLLRKTLVGGTVTNPPTQLVVISSLGTERTNKMPYSMQNMMGGKLDKRRQVEEAVLRVVRDRMVEPPLDYTICKLGELKDTVKDSFQMLPGDSLDGSVTVDTAVKILEQAIALQPAARNATLSLIGKLTDLDTAQEVLDDAFLKLDGPELFRTSIENGDYDQLVKFLSEWASLLAETSKGLTTPVRAERSLPRAPPMGVKRQAGVQLLFLPTATGKNYVSAREEAAMEKEKGGGPRRGPTVVSSKRKEGGVEIVAEVLNDDTIRIRAKRCNYADDAVIKELSEETILSRMKETIQVWKKDHP